MEKWWISNPLFEVRVLVGSPLWVHSSNGRANDSKSLGWGFESLCACHFVICVIYFWLYSLIGKTTDFESEVWGSRPHRAAIELDLLFE